jgi:PilZ domain-containing protein
VGSGVPAPPELVHLTLNAPKGGLRVQVQGRVVRHVPAHGEDEDAMAIEFLEIDEAEKDHLATLVARVIEGGTPGPLEALKPGAPAHEVRKALEAIPLPHRIALAARAAPRDREFLRQDSHPQVLESLARNPNLLQQEAHAIATVLHLLPTTLELLIADTRWAEDEDLRVLVLAHPRAPFPLAERVLAQLRPPALKRLLQRNLPATIREKVAKRLRQLSS